MIMEDCAIFTWIFFFRKQPEQLNQHRERRMGLGQGKKDAPDLRFQFSQILFKII